MEGSGRLKTEESIIKFEESVYNLFKEVKALRMQPAAKNAIANSYVLETELAKKMARTGPKKFKVSDNKLLPKPAHSVFGDFPKTHMPAK